MDAQEDMQIRVFLIHPVNEYGSTDFHLAYQCLGFAVIDLARGRKRRMDFRSTRCSSPPTNRREDLLIHQMKGLIKKRSR